MKKIQIKDLPKNMKVSNAELKTLRGGPSYSEDEEELRRLQEEMKEPQIIWVWGKTVVPEMMSNMTKVVHDTSIAAIRKISL